MTEGGAIHRVVRYRSQCSRFFSWAAPFSAITISADPAARLISSLIDAGNASSCQPFYLSFGWTGVTRLRPDWVKPRRDMLPGDQRATWPSPCSASPCILRFGKSLHSARGWATASGWSRRKTVISFTDPARYLLRGEHGRSVRPSQLAPLQLPHGRSRPCRDIQWQGDHRRGPPRLCEMGSRCQGSVSPGDKR
jgi:hypothetical protein